MDKLIKKSVPYVSLVAWLVIEAMVVINPSNTLPIRNISFYTIIYFVISTFSAFFLPFWALKKDKAVFFRFFICGIFILQVFSLFGGIIFHRDFTVYCTQAMILFLVIFLFRIEELNIVKKKNIVYRNIFIASVIGNSLWLIWLIFMCYAIITRNDPRWIESIFYNLTNCIIALICFYISIRLFEQIKKRLYIS